MASRRGHGEGSIYRTDDGRWRAVIDCGWKDGHRDRKYLSGKTRVEVAQKLRVALAAHERGLPLPDDRLTVAGWMTEWLDNVLPGQVAEGTLETYGRTAKRQVTPSLGKVKLSKLTPQRVQQWLQELGDEDYAPRTIRRAHATLSAALSAAERWEIVPRNVARLVTPPSAGEAKKDPLTAGEAKALLAAAKGHRLESLVAVGLAVGLRRGEALGLRWDDINFESATLTVRRSLSRRTGRGLVASEPKTERAGGTIPLPAVTLKVLRDHRKRQAEDRLAAGPEWADTGYVVTTRHGKPVDPVVLWREFRDLCVLAKVRPRRFHDLRHSAATLLYEQGVSLELISDTLRHAGLSITKDVYASFRPERQPQAAEAMDRILSGESAPRS